MRHWVPWYQGVGYIPCSSVFVMLCDGRHTVHQLHRLCDGRFAMYVLICDIPARLVKEDADRSGMVVITTRREIQNDVTENLSEQQILLYGFVPRPCYTQYTSPQNTTQRLTLLPGNNKLHLHTRVKNSRKCL